MKSVIWLITGACFVWFPAERLAASDPPGGQRAPESWTTPGTQWRIHVRKYSTSWRISYGSRRLQEEAQEPRIESEFHVHVTVLEPRVECEWRVARIEFRPLGDAPDYYSNSVYVLEINADNGQPLALKEVAGNVGWFQRIENGDDEPILFSETDFPTSWIVSMADLARVPDKSEDRSATVQCKASPEARIPIQMPKKLRPTAIESGHLAALEVDVATPVRRPDAVPYYRVVQTWVPGEGWWRSYKGYIQNHINLEATLVEQKEPPPK